MKVLHITEACSGGVQTHLKWIIPGLMSRGVECQLLAFGNRFSSTFEEMAHSLGCPVEMVPLKGHRFSVLLKALPVLRRAYHRSQADLIHLHSYMAGLAGRWVASSTRAPIVYSPHAFPTSPPVVWFQRMLATVSEKLQEKVTSKFALIGPGDEYEARKLALSPQKLYSCWNGLPSDIPLKSRREAREILQIPQEQRIGVILGRLVPQKGILTALEALALLGAAAPQIRIYGDGPLKQQAMAMVQKKNLPVLFFAPRDDLSLLLKAFDFAILPSFYEGLSYALLELARAGVPSIISDIPGNRLGKPEAFRGFPPGDAQALAKVLQLPLPDPACAQTLVSETVTLQAQLERLVRLYQALGKGEPLR